LALADPSAQSGSDTFPRLLLQHARERPTHPACREKDLGIWQTWSWGQVADEVRALACGLAAQGCIWRHRRQPPTHDAARSPGGIPVPMYQDAPAAEFVSC
jgi:long-chain acyl-CoA synthetase